jgi:hypothetical protein
MSSADSTKGEHRAYMAEHEDGEEPADRQSIELGKGRRASNVGLSPCQLCYVCHC